MSRELVNEICAAQPGSEWSDPWGGGHDCWKIGGKTFAVTGTQGTHVSVKTDGEEIANFLIETGIGMRAPYLHRSWVALPLDSAPDELAHRIRQSYRIVRSGLPKKIQAGLPPVV
ncbi:MmcQ/YjbR family DNA-binding protein [Paracoccus sp. MBLB3053]|uniref:MmcQ/YjbR family DNA-binding protein n=1 Tax=Paracoccus aurantius TaxID=3073814 RepID=A0ABU2HV17_9RHOB|nr:MmcQ/YjbR family DNA-binding protein [Paracoccus sp. MBLB3053]MDS9468375.1 MmcQ/YjbR family DNA-binding protein [Paracoccus sp. MBLB3053]